MIIIIVKILMTTATGYGFELTFRLKRSAEDNDTPPVWPMNMPQNLARYVFSTGNVFASGHHLNGNDHWL